MATATKLLIATLLLFFLKVNGQKCDDSNVEIQVTNAGNKFRFDTIYEVEVKNTCTCPLVNVYVFSEGFSSSMVVDPKLFRRDRDGYLVNDGKEIPSNQSVKFQYAWVRPFKMTPQPFSVAC